MNQVVKLNELETILTNIEYPISRDTLIDEYGDTTIQLADGTVDLDTIIHESSTERFLSTDDVTNELMSLLPRNAVGEPFQSEGDA